jgi:hypothetical protein
MAILHVVFLALKDGMESEERKRVHREFKAAIRQVPGVESVEFGQNFRPTESQFTDVAVVRLIDRDALAAYGPHEKHQEAGRLLGPYMKDVLALDLEI